MSNEQIKAKVRNILSSSVGMIGRDTAFKLLDALEAAERDRDELRATISGPIKEIDNLKLRIESLMGRVDLFESTAPTPFAYNAACKALDKHRARADAAEAEIARRDAAAGEPVAWEITTKPGEFSLTPDKSTAIRAITNGCCVRELHATVPPAVLPPEKPVNTDLSRTDIMKNIAYNQALNDVKALGAQSQKPVTIPGRYDIAEMSGDPWQSYRCIEPDDDGEYIRLDEILSALNDAGVPHNGGK